MRAHELWCASRYRGLHGDEQPGACDCGAERENAQQLSTFNPLKKGKKGKARWAGNLPPQFCLQCEGARVKRYEVLITPADGTPPYVRTFAVCLDCLNLREVEIAREGGKGGGHVEG